MSKSGRHLALSAPQKRLPSHRSRRASLVRHCRCGWEFAGATSPDLDDFTAAIQCSLLRLRRCGKKCTGLHPETLQHSQTWTRPSKFI
ncbi:hypothetical protein KY289_030885 [Solanum tuberosum]|nr:hypothetical protein KY289_030885 [Solanum tuberosum]